MRSVGPDHSSYVKFCVLSTSGDFATSSPRIIATASCRDLDRTIRTAKSECAIMDSVSLETVDRDTHCSGPWLSHGRYRGLRERMDPLPIRSAPSNLSLARSAVTARKIRVESVGDCPSMAGVIGPKTVGASQQVGQFAARLDGAHRQNISSQAHDRKLLAGGDDPRCATGIGPQMGCVRQYASGVCGLSAAFEPQRMVMGSRPGRVDGQPRGGDLAGSGSAQRLRDVA